MASPSTLNGRGLGITIDHGSGLAAGDERLDVLPLELAGDERVAVSLAVGGQQPDGVGVGLDMVRGVLFSASRVRRKLRLRTSRWARGSWRPTSAGSMDDIVFPLIRV
jgi:hypothetical protein